MNPSPSQDRPADAASDDDEPLADERWEPLPDEASRYRSRLTEELRPLVDSIRRLRERGLLD